MKLAVLYKLHRGIYLQIFFQLSFMNKRPDAIRQFTCVATNISLNFTNSFQLKQMLEEKASYQVIPCTTQVFYGDVWKTIIDILPLSNNVLLDICLPFNHSVRGKTSSHTARFFLLNNKILGIKIRTGPTWNRYNCQEYRLPQEILNYYKKSDQRVGMTPSKCLVGQFYINHKNFKLCPLFSSEIQQNPQILSEYQKYGCDIFSVVDDVPSDNITDVSAIARKLINKNDMKSCPIIFTGCKTSTNPVKCYWANSFIIQGQNKRQVYHNPFLPFSNIKLNINVEDCIVYRNYTEIQKFIDNYQQGDQIIKDLSTKNQFIRFANPYSYEINEKKPQQFKADTSLKKSVLYLWFLYNQLNNRNPFTVGVPFTQTVLALVYLVNQMKNIVKNYVKIDKPLLKIYHFAHTDSREQNFWPSNLQVCNQASFYQSIESMLLAQKYSKIYIYCDYFQQFKVFKQKTIQYRNIHLCKGMLVDKFIIDKKVDRSYLRKNQNMGIEPPANRTLETLCQDILNKKYLTLQSMYRHFTSKDESVENLVKAFTEIMPQKIRINMNLTPPHNYLLQAPKQRIQKQLEEIQIKLIRPSGLKLGMQEQKTNVIDLQSKLKQIRENKMALKKQFSTCHCCQQISKKSFVKTCEKCKNQICIQCNSKKITNRNMELTQFERLISSNCPYCLQTCRCKLCLNKMERRDEQMERRRKKYELSDYCIKDTCLKCQLSERTRKSIEIQCESCHKVFCLQCLKVEEGLSPKYFLEKWTCRQCRDILVLRKQKSKVELERQRQLQMNFQILPHETPQALRQTIQQDQMIGEIQTPRQPEGITIQINRQKKSSSSSSSSSKSRSRNKKRKKSSSSSSNSSSSSSSSSSKIQRKKKLQKKVSNKSQKIDQPTFKQGEKNNYRNYNNQDRIKKPYSQNKPNYQPREQNYQKYGEKKREGHDNSKNNWANRNKQQNRSREQGEQGLWNATGSSRNFNNREEENRNNFTIFQVDNTKPSNYEEPIDY